MAYMLVVLVYKAHDNSFRITNKLLFEEKAKQLFKL